MWERKTGAGKYTAKTIVAIDEMIALFRAEHGWGYGPSKELLPVALPSFTPDIAFAGDFSKAHRHLGGAQIFQEKGSGRGSIGRLISPPPSVRWQLPHHPR